MARSRRAAPARAAAPAPRAAPPAPAAPPPPAPPPAPMQQPQSGGMMSGLGGMVMQGMAMGTGSAIAHQAIGSMMGGGGGSSSPAEAPAAAAPVAAPYAAPDACGSHNKAFQDCLSSANGDISKCQFYYDMLNQCKTSA
mmetsp:Transcript_16463/g.22758  ORF Transcript_16463/g.22758 Transcript_16463/m.22758 type:complete len:139 (-) Transcript_16463:287-703(-)|eukprot:CAMPEP_0196577402 /NCGR_PEP_ID=MMETSP1081-20130531/6466_1 /TAXON_ID=36882 /ORGANISM="Pyramimonas amylifera, Strain CCMP720" /LENGTH=138 /DNA_ID=CAMNT_0041896325 /DNA_START=87 /DNA_END=503 /DNA_ORIENTATION=+